MTPVASDSLGSQPESESGAEHRHTVSPDQAGQRFDRILADLPGVPSRQAALRLIASGHARLIAEGSAPLGAPQLGAGQLGAGQLGAAPAAPDRKVRVGDIIAYRIPPPQPADTASEPAPADQPLIILYEDEWLVVIDKPAGLSMHPGPGHPGGTLVNHLLAHCRDLSGIGGTLRPGIVHRLDKDTSGVLVVAKHDAAHHALAAQFKAHSIHRVYLALVLGAPKAERGTIDLPLARHPQQRVKRAVVTRGKRAVTHWAVERRLGPLTLLRVTLETGRTHQIRVHLAHAGWPVLGDPLYGSPQRVKALKLPEELKTKLLAFPRQALHAAELGFVHPTTGKEMRFRAEMPGEMEELVGALK